jgi:hypothetical protein
MRDWPGLNRQRPLARPNPYSWERQVILKSQNSMHLSSKEIRYLFGNNQMQGLLICKGYHFAWKFKGWAETLLSRFPHSSLKAPMQQGEWKPFHPLLRSKVGKYRQYFDSSLADSDCIDVPDSSPCHIGGLLTNDTANSKLKSDPQIMIDRASKRETRSFLTYNEYNRKNLTSLKK